MLLFIFGGVYIQVQNAISRETTENMNQNLNNTPCQCVATVYEFRHQITVRNKNISLLIFFGLSLYKWIPHQKPSTAFSEMDTWVHVFLVGNWSIILFCGMSAFKNIKNRHLCLTRVTNSTYFHPTYLTCNIMLVTLWHLKPSGVALEWLCFYFRVRSFVHSASPLVRCETRKLILQSAVVTGLLLPAVERN
jgi:hypothetical protein